MSAERKPRGLRKHVREEKARERRGIGADVSVVDENRRRALGRVEEIEVMLISYLKTNQTEGGLGEDVELDYSSVEESLRLGRGITKKMEASMSNGNVMLHRDAARKYIERAWIRDALGLASREQTSREIVTFLDSCPVEMADYLEGNEPGEMATRLQLIRNRVISPVTKQLVIG